MFKTLYARLAFSLLALLVFVGVLYISLSQYATRQYLHEVSQEHNRNLAAQLLAGRALIRHGKVNRTSLSNVFRMYMDINPNIEIYLLDRDGKILAFSAPADKIKRKRVPVKPLKAMLQGHAPLPIMAADPRDRVRQKVFSVAPVLARGQTVGYLYVVLHSEKYDSIATLLTGSYIFQLSAVAVITSLLLALIAGLLIFSLLTRRLSKLSQAMQAFQENDYQLPASGTNEDHNPGDEVGQLATNFKHMAERIGKHMQSLKRTDSLRRELVANVSHDLRTPIALLQGYLETLLLKETQLTAEERRRYTEIALKHSERLGKLVTELFELARLDAGDIRPKVEPLAIHELVQDVLLKFQLKTQELGITVDYQLKTNMPLVYGDIALLERVLENLIENALRNTLQGGTLRITLNQENNGVIVNIIDTGCGIPADKIDKIFDRFYQADKNESNQAHGSGLGLAISKRILDLHNSPIWVQSTINKGTQFAFSLPVHKNKISPNVTEM